MAFTDIHMHALWGVDDGPRDRTLSEKMILAAYEDGTRVLCLTPHFHPGYFGNNGDRVAEVFTKLQIFAREACPELQLYLGNELRYSSECISWLETGDCRTLNDTNHVLVDFSSGEKERNIIRGMNSLMSAGYVPVLAHVERYRELSAQAVRQIANNGVRLQIDVQSLFGGYGFGAAQRAKAMLKAGVVDLVGSDAHDLEKRTPQMSRGYGWVVKKYGTAYADAIFCENALRLLREDSQEGKEDYE